MPALLRPIGPTASGLARGRDTHHREDNVVNTPPAATGPAIEDADALDWLADRRAGAATAVI
jgi:hypothetical protein